MNEEHWKISGSRARETIDGTTSRATTLVERSTSETCMDIARAVGRAFARGTSGLTGRERAERSTASARFLSKTMSGDDVTVTFSHN